MTDATTSSLQSSQQQLVSSLDKLNATWKDVNERLRKLNLPVHAFGAMSEEDIYDNTGHCSYVEYSCLKWTRHAGEWQVCLFRRPDHGDPWEYTLTPILECSAEERVKRLDDVPQLTLAMVEAAKGFSNVVEEKLAEFQKKLF